jgi:UDP-N-acetylglucosamine 2-epimerase (non-hydrolysing)
MIRVLSVIGTRPEAVKMAPVVARLAAQPQIASRVLVTAQHREMLDQVLDAFGMTPDYDLDVMHSDQSPAAVLAAVVPRLGPVLDSYRPDWVLVQGDTTTVLAAALTAAYAGCRVAHVEAGLRSYDRENPFPEEINRVLADHVSSLCFAPTEVARQALLKEGIPDDVVYVTGNPVVDALMRVAKGPLSELPVDVPPGRRLILVTAHRRENHGEPLERIFAALGELAARGDVHVLYPVHRNPHVWGPAHEVLGDLRNVTLVEPMGYRSFVGAMKRAYLILTDSGGLQEEAPSLGVPVLLMRSVTERPEGVAAGAVRVVGTESASIVAEATRLLDNPDAHAAMARVANPFGDGRASERIVDILCRAGA